MQAQYYIIKWGFWTNYFDDTQQKYLMIGLNLMTLKDINLPRRRFSITQGACLKLSNMMIGVKESSPSGNGMLIDAISNLMFYCRSACWASNREPIIQFREFRARLKLVLQPCSISLLQIQWYPLRLWLMIMIFLGCYKGGRMSPYVSLHSARMVKNDRKWRQVRFRGPLQAI